MREGICKLTGQHGKFVNAHLIPRALTPASSKGMIQSNGDDRPVRRWSSWHDANLVIEEGERVLANYDNWAIAELRKHRLVWSGWDALAPAAPHVRPIPDLQGCGVREVSGIDGRRLRLFFLSLLWRAAATDLREFAPIEMPAEDLELLRRMVLAGNPEPLSFYPLQLIQLATRGFPHNYTPTATTKTLPPVADRPERKVPIFRFYFDGLITHFHREYSAAYDDGSPFNVGSSDRLIITTVTSQSSKQSSMFWTASGSAEEKWPNVVARLSRS